MGTGNVNNKTPGEVVALPQRVRCSTSFAVETLPSGRKIAKVFLIVDGPQGAMVIGTLEANFENTEHARVLQMGFGQLLGALPQDIVRV
jgi:hypothetical protein